MSGARSRRLQRGRHSAACCGSRRQPGELRPAGTPLFQPRFFGRHQSETKVRQVILSAVQSALSWPAAVWATFTSEHAQETLLTMQCPRHRFCNAPPNACCGVFVITTMHFFAVHELMKRQPAFRWAFPAPPCRVFRLSESIARNNIEQL